MSAGMRPIPRVTRRAAPWVAVLSLLAIAAAPAAAQSPVSGGTISGRVVSSATQEPVPGAAVRVAGLEPATTTDVAGRFVLRGVAPGVRALEVRRIGYEPAVRSDVAVGVARPAEVLVELRPAALELEAVTVAPPLFSAAPPPATPVSTQTFSAEEVRRAPGVQEDLVRALSVAGGIAAIPAGPRNDLLVRGGAAFENLFVVDGVEVPNINHFGSQGSTGGAVSLVNVAFVREASISAGGFGARYGDRTSSVADVRLREGSRERRSGALNLSATGVSAYAEGPLWREASFLAGVRRSYLDLLFRLGGVPLVPAYSDATVKAVWRPTPADRLSFLALGAADRVTFDNSTAENRYENSRSLAPAQDQYFSGLTWQRSLTRGVGTLTLGRTWTRFRTVQLDSGTVERAPLPVLRAYATEGETSLRGDLTLQPGGGLTLDLGAAARYAGGLEYDLLLDGDLRRDADGAPRPLATDTSFSAFRGAAYAQAALDLTSRLRASLGTRADWYAHPDGAVRVAPRAALSYRVGEDGSVTLAGGRYWQAPSFLWLVGDPSNAAALRPFRADQVVASVSGLLRRDLRLQVEGYVKRYARYPARVFRPRAVYQPTGFDDVTSDIPLGLEPLLSEGTGRVWGVDVVLQKRLSESPFYGVLSASYNHSRFAALDGVTVRGAFDSPFTGSLLLGWRPGAAWEVSGRARAAAGLPVTPYVTEGPQAGRLDYARFNEGGRYPAFVSVDLRVDRRWTVRRTQLIGYVDVQNANGRRNVSFYQWDPRTRSVQTQQFLAVLPSIGLTWEF